MGGALTLAGWLLGLPRLIAWDGTIAMKFNTGVLAALSGMNLVLLSLGTQRPRAVRTLAAVVAVVGGLTLLEHLSSLSLGIDTLFFDEPPGLAATTAPGRMGPPAATSFLVLGVCLLLATGGASARRVGSALALLPLMIAALGVIGHVYRASEFYTIARLTGTALQTAAIVAALAIGTLLASPEHGLVAALRRDDPGGDLLRRLGWPVMGICLVLGALRLVGERAGLYDAAFGTAARTLLEIVLFVALIWWSAEHVSRYARATRDAEAALRDDDRRKDEFLATLAHELRNPLAPLRTSAERIRRKADDANAVRAANQIIERQLEQLVHLVDDLLDINRVRRGTIELRKTRLDLATVVDRAIETSRPVIDGFEHELVWARPATPIVIDGDVTRLTQAVANLLNNAAKYTSSGGRIRIGLEREGGEAVVRVRDNGMGIPPELGRDVFQMFVHAKGPLERAGGGLGIGLALVKRLVELHGGVVDVESPPRPPGPEGPAGGSLAGSEFSIRLPALPAGTTASAPVLEEAVRPVDSPARLRVLIADDNMDAGEGLAMLIEEMGHETRVAQDGAEALAAIHVFRPDVAFLDIGMPKLSGYDVSRSIRAERWGNQVVLVALTGWGQPDDRRQSAEAGFDEHLVKPTGIEVIERVLASVQRRAGRLDAGSPT